MTVRQSPTCGGRLLILTRRYSRALVVVGARASSC